MRAMSMLALVMLLMAAMSQAQETMSHNRPGLSLMETYNLYLKAIEKRDVDALMSTVSDGKIFVFLNSRGERLESKSEYRNFHVEWFAEQNWSMSTRLIKLHEGPEFGFVLSTYHYESTDEEGEPTGSEGYPDAESEAESQFMAEEESESSDLAEMRE